MMVLITAAKAKKTLANNVKKRRLAMDLTQMGLSKRSGVALSTLRKFEQQGEVSVDNLFKLLLVVGGLQDVVSAIAPDEVEFESIEDVLDESAPKKRQRGSRS